MFALFSLQPDRGLEMTRQLRIKDKDGMTVAMHAARSGNIAIVAALTVEIELYHVSGSVYRRCLK